MQIIAFWSTKQNSCELLNEWRRLQIFLSSPCLASWKALTSPSIKTLSHAVPSALRSHECWHHQEPKTPCQGRRTGGNTEMQPSERTQLSFLSAAPGGRSEIHDWPWGSEKSYMSQECHWSAFLLNYPKRDLLSWRYSWWSWETLQCVSGPVPNPYQRSHVLPLHKHSPAPSQKQPWAGEADMSD